MAFFVKFQKKRLVFQKKKNIFIYIHTFSKKKEVNMPRIVTDELERKINVSVTLSAKTIARFDENIERLRNDFKALGMNEKELKRTICRSGLIGEFVELLANPQGYAMIKSVIRLALGVDYDQEELFDRRK